MSLVNSTGHFLHCGENHHRAFRHFSLEEVQNVKWLKRNLKSTKGVSLPRLPPSAGVKTLMAHDDHQRDVCAQFYRWPVETVWQSGPISRKTLNQHIYMFYDKGAALKLKMSLSRLQLWDRDYWATLSFVERSVRLKCDLLNRFTYKWIKRTRIRKALLLMMVQFAGCSGPV